MVKVWHHRDYLYFIYVAIISFIFQKANWKSFLDFSYIHEKKIVKFLMRPCSTYDTLDPGYTYLMLENCVLPGEEVPSLFASLCQ